MKFFFIILFWFVFGSMATASTDRTFHIVIDPGHGGQDYGATRDAFVEARIVLQIAHKVKSQLDRESNIKTTLTRTNDSGLSLKNRVLLANAMKADLFVSLHANTSTSSAISGMEFYFNSTRPKSLIEKEVIPENRTAATNAEVIEKIRNDFLYYEKTEKSLLLTKTFHEKSQASDLRGIIKRAPFYVIDHTAMPAILIELGFISNRREAKKLTSENYQNEMAHVLTSAILNYKEKSDKLHSL